MFRRFSTSTNFDGMFSNEYDVQEKATVAVTETSIYNDTIDLNRTTPRKKKLRFRRQREPKKSKSFLLYFDLNTVRRNPVIK